MASRSKKKKLNREGKENYNESRYNPITEAFKRGYNCIDMTNVLFGPSKTECITGGKPIEVK